MFDKRIRGALAAVVLAPALLFAVPNPIPDPFQAADSNVPPSGAGAPGTLKLQPLAGVTVTWYGQSCFAIADKLGHLVLTDPFSPSLGYPTPSVLPTLVTISHDHPDHNYTQPFAKNALIIRKLGETSAGGLLFNGIRSWHDDQKGAKRGANRIYLWTMGGLRLAHLGDLGQTQLSKSQLTALRGVDVLFVPVGGVYTIDAGEAAKIVKQLRPAVVIPMHFKTPQLTVDLQPADAFLHDTELPVQDKAAARIDLRQDQLPARTTIMLLRPVSEMENAK